VHSLAGEHTVRQARQTHAGILAALRDHTDIRLECSAVTEADLSLIQIILAANSSAAAAGKRFTLHAPPDGTIRDALERGGFANPGSADPADWRHQGQC
jgi:multidrug efflux pump subunit AcrA (membrane-fusion protein)